MSRFIVCSLVLILPAVAWSHGESDSLLHYVTHGDHAAVLLLSLVALIGLGALMRRRRATIRQRHRD